jgi:pimeloyl-ACP methyl ester carboxylesterase
MSSTIIPSRGPMLALPVQLPFLKSHPTTIFRSSQRPPPMYAAPPVTLPSISNRRNRVSTPNARNTQRPSRLIVVYGYGCDTPFAMQKRKNALNKIRKGRKKFSYIDVICNENSKDMTANIARRIASAPNTLKTTRFVQQVMDRVVSAILAGERVTLVGYSYGGSIVSRVAIELRKRFGKVSHLKALTLGSIYIPNPTQTEGVNIRHYAFDNDIARVCHKRSGGCSFVKFLKPKTGYGPLKSHLDYHDYITAIAMTGSTNLNKVL